MNKQATDKTMKNLKGPMLYVLQEGNKLAWVKVSGAQTGLYSSRNCKQGLLMKSSQVTNPRQTINSSFVYKQRFFSFFGLQNSLHSLNELPRTAEIFCLWGLYLSIATLLETETVI